MEQELECLLNSCKIKNEKQLAKVEDLRDEILTLKAFNNRHIEGLTELLDELNDSNKHLRKNWSEKIEEFRIAGQMLDDWLDRLKAQYNQLRDEFHFDK